MTDQQNNKPPFQFHKQRILLHLHIFSFIICGLNLLLMKHLIIAQGSIIFKYFMHVSKR